MSNPSEVFYRKNWYIHEGENPYRLQLDKLTQMYIGYMFDRTLRMFEYEGLPDGINYKDIEKFTQAEGQSFFLKHNGRFYVLNGSFTNYVTWNYEPSEAIIRNPSIPSLNTRYYLNKDCVAIPNDSHYIGLFPMLETNAIQMASTDISLNYALFNSRFKSLFTANDDETADSLNKLLDDVFEGRKPSVIVTDDLYKKSIESVEYNRSQSNDIKDLIELKQYIKANWYIDLGINANYNMKREALNENELQSNDDALMPLIDDMLQCREKAVEKINEIFNLNISVKLSSAWAKLRKEIELEEEQLENAVEEPNEEKEGDSVEIETQDDSESKS